MCKRHGTAVSQNADKQAHHKPQRKRNVGFKLMHSYHPYVDDECFILQELCFCNRGRLKDAYMHKPSDRN
jgi:hypothetical protein